MASCRRRDGTTNRENLGRRNRQCRRSCPDTCDLYPCIRHSWMTPRMSNSTDQLVIWVLSRHRRPDTLEMYQTKTRRLLTSLQTAYQNAPTLVATTEREIVPITVDSPQLNETIHRLV